MCVWFTLISIKSVRLTFIVGEKLLLLSLHRCTVCHALLFIYPFIHSTVNGHLGSFKFV